MGFSSSKNICEIRNLLESLDSILSNYRRMGVKRQNIQYISIQIYSKPGQSAATPRLFFGPRSQSRVPGALAQNVIVTFFLNFAHARGTTISRSCANFGSYARASFSLRSITRGRDYFDVESVYSYVHQCIRILTPTFQQIRFTISKNMGRARAFLPAPLARNLIVTFYLNFAHARGTTIPRSCAICGVAPCAVFSLRPRTRDREQLGVVWVRVGKCIENMN